MTPWEVKDHFVFLLGDAVPHPALPGVQQSMLDFARRWQAAWSRFGEDLVGAPVYRALLQDGRAEVVARGAGEIGLRNEIGLLFMLDSLVFDSALAGVGDSTSRLDVHGGMAPARDTDAGPSASGADVVLEQAQVFETVQEAVADCSTVFASTVRRRDLVMPVVTPEQMAEQIAASHARTAILF